MDDHSLCNVMLVAYGNIVHAWYSFTAEDNCGLIAEPDLTKGVLFCVQCRGAATQVWGQFAPISPPSPLSCMVLAQLLFGRCGLGKSSRALQGNDITELEGERSP